MRYRDSIRRRRVMDRVARHIKYNDGIKDIVDKIKSKISEFISQFKDAPGGRKILSLLSSALSAANAIYAAKSIADVTRDTKRLIGYKKMMAQEIKYYSNKYGTNVGLSENGKIKLNNKKLQVFISSLKLVMALIATFVSAVNAKLAIAQKQVQEGEDNERIIAETMTR